jgi:hypothetical protein
LKYIQMTATSAAIEFEWSTSWPETLVFWRWRTCIADEIPQLCLPSPVGIH